MLSDEIGRPKSSSEYMSKALLRFRRHSFEQRSGLADLPRRPLQLPKGDTLASLPQREGGLKDILFHQQSETVFLSQLDVARRFHFQRHVSGPARLVRKQSGTISPLSSAASLDKQCAICLDLLELGGVANRNLDCGHSFHEVCIDNWAKTLVTSDPLREHSCPICSRRRSSGHSRVYLALSVIVDYDGDRRNTNSSGGRSAAGSAFGFYYTFARFDY